MADGIDCPDCSSGRVLPKTGCDTCGLSWAAATDAAHYDVTAGEAPEVEQDTHPEQQRLELNG